VVKEMKLNLNDEKWQKNENEFIFGRTK